MKTIFFIILFSGISIAGKCQNANTNLTGKWYSIDGRKRSLAFTTSIERKYVIKKDIKRVPINEKKLAAELISPIPSKFPTIH